MPATSLFTKLFRRTPKTYRHAKPAARVRLGLTALEAREVPATAVLSAGILTVTGTAGNDVIAVAQSGTTITAAGKTFVADKVQSIVVNAKAGNDTVTVTSAKPATLDGGDGNDTMTGGSGADALYGRAGNDKLAGGSGRDSVYGGDGNDTATGGAGDDFLSGDDLGGAAGNDKLDGGTGNDDLDGGAGNDGLKGGTGDDRLSGGDGRDSLSGAAGADTVYGGAGNDTLAGGDGWDVLYGEAGNDRMTGDGGGDWLLGGDGDDTLAGGDGGDQVHGEAGNDRLIGAQMTGPAEYFGDADSITGGAGNDTVLAGYGDDTVGGGAGDDYLLGEDGNDRVYGEAGNDFLDGNGGNDLAYGGDGNDDIGGGDGSDTLDGNSGNDTLTSGTGDDAAWGGPGDDWLFGEAGNDYLDANAGADRIYAGNGNDTAHGGEGNDLVYGEAGNDVLFGHGEDDRVYGGDGDDWVYGGAGQDTVTGGAGNDQVLGEDGSDQVIGGAGVDALYGGNGDDALVMVDAGTGDSADGGAGYDTAWRDLNWSYFGIFGWVPFTDTATAEYTQDVSGFANGPDRTLDGDGIADPTDAGTTQNFAANPLFGVLGPHVDDVDQQALGDCWLMAPLSAMANDRPHTVRRMVADFGDGTYGVRLGNSVYRVDADLPTWGSWSSDQKFAGLGHGGSLWVALVEKAYTHFRTGANTYASLANGDPRDALRAYNLTGVDGVYYGAGTNAATVANQIYSRWNGYQSCSICTGGTAAAGLVANHCYAVTSVSRDAWGNVTSITFRNPWGADDTGGNPYVTLTPAQLAAQEIWIRWGNP